MKKIEITSEFSGTPSWQPEYLRANKIEQSQYLAVISQSTIILQAAAASHLLLALKPGQTVLEVGCGSGLFLPGLAEKVKPTGRVIGIDHSDVFVTEARKFVDTTPHGSVVSVEVADVYKLPYPDGYFDAAHCERVLMHLEDPSAALREMARVVRPGGVVVVAEPDWAGIRIDHPDPEIFQQVYRSALTSRQRDVGLTLNRRFAEAGLVERRFSPISTFSTDFAHIRRYGLKLEAAVETLLLAGQLPADRLRDVIPALERASATGTFYSVGIYHIVSGKVVI